MIVAVLALALAVAPMGGSNAPTPYTVDGSGITLPTGETFPDNGHVNVTTITGSFSLHFEEKCITRTDAECAGARHAAAQFIGDGFIPWSAFGILGCDRVVWVQLSAFNEHFGEGGQPSVEVAPCGVTPPTDPPVETAPPVEPPVETSPSDEDQPTLSATGDDAHEFAWWLLAGVGAILLGSILIPSWRAAWRNPEQDR